MAKMARSIENHQGRGPNEERAYTVTPNWVSQPGPVLQAATRGNIRKGKKPKAVPSAAQVAMALARRWKGGV